MTRPVLNPAASPERQYVLSQNAEGKNVVEPLIQQPGYDSALFLQDTYSNHPVDAKDALHKALKPTTLNRPTAPVKAPTIVETLLVLSTTHVSEETAQWLRTQGRIAAACEVTGDEHPALNVGATPYGFFLYVPEPDSWADSDFPNDLKAVFAFVHEQGHAYVYLDCDGSVVHELPTYDW
ncbi:hypothetical protein GCM10019059_37950 [Camelimonas fluminis]|uniref:DUF5983 domain-containing protein n=1 Tax=Camelimonas fluminis TaxID=1576911 RepID=A0ABV7UAW3_9HYPH|nr:hypothetical protein [Camelimonas fluminis]GHE74881.1 hypothetical protein GCM10019059_37950 [Camelimonas fluminis]